MTAIGILGGGNISETHLRAAIEVEGVEVTAVCGRNPEKVGKLAELAEAAVYTRLDQFLSHRPMDIVVIGSPSGVHSEQGVQAARRGLHVLVEKPIDVSVERANRLIEECRKQGVKLGVFFQDRVSEGPLRIKKLLEQGKLGDPVLATAHVKWYRPPEYYADSKWRGTWALDGGGALMNQGIHTLDLLTWLLGKAGRIFAFARTQVHSIETEDTLVACLEFQNGALAAFEATTAAYPGIPRRLYLSGSRGTALIEHDRLTSLDLIEDKDAAGQSARQPAQVADRSLSESSPVVSNTAGHRALIEDFINAVREDRDPVCSGTEGRRSLVLAEAIYESARTGKAVKLD